MLLVQIPDTQIQIGSKGQPDQIGNLQFGCQRIHLSEGKDHPKHQPPQKQQPEKGKAEGLGVEEDRTPEKIDHKLCDEEVQSQTPGFGWRSLINPCRSDTHQCEQDRPDHRKYPTRRRQRRFRNGLAVKGGTVPGQPAGKCAYGFCEKNPEKIWPPVSFHDASPGTGYAAVDVVIRPAVSLQQPRLPYL